jgi:hypothetical protein
MGSYHKEQPHEALRSLPSTLCRERVLAAKNSISRTVYFTEKLTAGLQWDNRHHIQ